MFGKSLPALLLVVAVAGCGRSAPTVPTPDELTLYAIDGLVDEPKDFVSDATHFRGYEILGQVEITDPAARQKIMQAIEDGMYEGSVASCFWPRHGVHVVTNGKAVDYVICYECRGMAVFSADGHTGYSISRSHQKVLTDPLTAAGIKLAPDMKEKAEASRKNSN